MELSEIVPWGRSYAEYEAMFGLSDADSRANILGCGDGPASFNAELTAMGGSVLSIDPIYEFEGAIIAQRFEEVAPGIIAQVRESASDWVWTYHSGPEELLESRRRSLNRFLEDYDQGRDAGRYRAAALPSLPFSDCQFDLALCSHFLFLYSALLSEEFHVGAVIELCRVADEVRIFPLLTLSREPSPHVAPVCEAVEALGFSTEILRVPYEFQRGGNEMLRIQRR